MTTPAPSLMLRITLGKDGPYQPGDEVAVDVRAFTQAVDTATVSGTLPDGTTVNGTAEIPVLIPEPGAQLGINPSRLGITFSQEDGPDGSKVFKGTVVALPAQTAPAA